MNKRIYGILLLCASVHWAYAQEPQVIQRDGLVLRFLNNDPSFSAVLKERMIKTFFEVYPVLRQTYNKNAATEVTFSVDTAYKGVAAAGGGRIVYNPQWFQKQPGDIDVVTHEVMHIVQNYGRGGGPGWLTEGIADYVRFKFGVDNQGAGWALPAFKPEHHYKNAYRVTARFLHWLEINGHAGIVIRLDEAMRAHTYQEELWKTITGKSLDDLWLTYSQNPTI